MKNYVADPQNPGKYLDTIELQKRNPQEPLPPVDIVALLKWDKWPRKDALLILAGYHPRNEVDGAGHPVGTVGAGIVFLDGTNQAMLDQAGLQHPRYPQMLHEFLPLAEYANGADDKEKSPQEWLAWAKGKGFTPYWMEYAEANQSAPSAKGGAAPDDGIKAIGQILAAAGMGVLALEVAKHEAIQQLQESPAANNLLNRYIALQPKSKPKPEVKEAPQPAQTAAQKVELVTDTSQKSDAEPWLIQNQNGAATKVEAKPVTASNNSKVYWRVVLKNNIKTFDAASKNGKATVREVIKSFQALNDVKIPCHKNADTLVWIDDMGSRQTAAKKTISNAMSEARKQQ